MTKNMFRTCAIGSYTGQKVSSFFVACLYRMHSCVDEYSQPTSPGHKTTSATASHTNFNHIFLWEIPVLVVVLTVIHGAVAALYLYLCKDAVCSLGELYGYEGQLTERTMKWKGCGSIRSFII